MKLITKVTFNHKDYALFSSEAHYTPYEDLIEVVFHIDTNELKELLSDRLRVYDIVFDGFEFKSKIINYRILNKVSLVKVVHNEEKHYVEQHSVNI